MTQRKKIKPILVGKDLIGLVGLDEIFEKLYQKGKKPDESSKQDLLRETKKHNYVPEGIEKKYEQALLREYKAFCKSKEKGEKIKEKDEEETYQGVPRESIPWFPTVYEEKCNGCKECFDMCPTRVYVWEEKTEKPKVVYPLRCVVGCSGCAQICKPKAISFPPKSVIDNILKRR